MSELAPFHIAFPVRDIAEARRFYGEVLGCPEGRSAADWVDFDLFGHQIVAHLKPGMEAAEAHHNPVDGHEVPVRHFGAILRYLRRRLDDAQSATAGLARLVGVVDEPAPVIADRADDRTTAGGPPSVTLTGVSHAYVPGRPVLHEHDLCGKTFDPVMTCSRCGEVLDPRKVHVHRGPGATSPRHLPPKTVSREA